MVREQEIMIHFSQGHAYSRGTGFGADSFSGVGYLNFPAGYAYIRNGVYREDGVLRPFYGQTNLGATAGTGAIKTIMAGRENELYVLTGDNKLMYSLNGGTTWTEATWAGAGDAPTFSAVRYTYLPIGAKFYFKSNTHSDPAYVVT